MVKVIYFLVDLFMKIYYTDGILKRKGNEMKKLLTILLLISNTCFGKSIYDYQNELINQRNQEEREIDDLANNPKYKKFFDNGYINLGNTEDRRKISIIKEVLSENKDFDKKSTDDKMFSNIFHNDPMMSSVTDYKCYMDEIHKTTTKMDYMVLEVEDRMSPSLKEANKNIFIAKVLSNAFEKCTDMDSYVKYNSDENIQNRIENEFREKYQDWDDESVKIRTKNVVDTYNMCLSTREEIGDTSEIMGEKILNCRKFYESNVEINVKEQLDRIKKANGGWLRYEEKNRLEKKIRGEERYKYWQLCTRYYERREDCGKFIR